MRLLSPSLSIFSSYSSSSFPSILLSFFIASFFSSSFTLPPHLLSSSSFSLSFSPLFPSLPFFCRSSEEREEDHMREGRRKEEKRRKEGKTSFSNTTSGSATTARQSKVSTVDLRAEPLLPLLLNYHTNGSAIPQTLFPTQAVVLPFCLFSIPLPSPSSFLSSPLYPSFHFVSPPLSSPFLLPSHLPFPLHFSSLLTSPFLSISPPFSPPLSLSHSFPLLPLLSPSRTSSPLVLLSAAHPGW